MSVLIPVIAVVSMITIGYLLKYLPDYLPWLKR
ncbi:hypothetical protein DFR70_10718 [Nocardia tenerifensis]|uniref:Uncharacterized protein n=1 Tax=Nocardia tenerifensis TaxID=228006 RepID=A0A318K2V6_9NOCA|nr:hypothetical protein DFR70_10718 [Nocardia tenerifensis]